MKKSRIKMLVDTSSGDIRAVEVEAEIYEYKGLQFGIYWPNRKTSIRAIELQTGFLFEKVRCKGTKTPKKDLLQRIADSVDKDKYISTISSARNKIAEKRWDLSVQIDKLVKKRDCLMFPINERIKI